MNAKDSTPEQPEEAQACAEPEIAIASDQEPDNAQVGKQKKGVGSGLLRLIEERYENYHYGNCI